MLLYYIQTLLCLNISLLQLIFRNILFKNVIVVIKTKLINCLKNLTYFCNKIVIMYHRNRLKSIFKILLDICRQVVMHEDFFLSLLICEMFLDPRIINMQYNRNSIHTETRTYLRVHIRLYNKLSFRYHFTFEKLGQ